MDTGIIILLIILFIGTLCVVFQRPIVDFLFRYCSFGTLLDKLNGAFLSRDEKERCGGLQIGLYNDSDAPGVQIGLLNHNPKAWLPWLPLVNCCFREE